MSPGINRDLQIELKQTGVMGASTGFHNKPKATEPVNNRLSTKKIEDLS